MPFVYSPLVFYLLRDGDCVDYRKLFTTAVVSGLCVCLVLLSCFVWVFPVCLFPPPCRKLKYRILDAGLSVPLVGGCHYHLSGLLASQNLLHEPASDPISWGSLWIGLFKINILPD